MQQKTITTTRALQDLCQRLSTVQHIAVDTEFMREKTYFAELCLIQVASENESAVIDPLADDIDLSSFYNLLQNPNVVKVFHSCRQDLEIFVKQMGVVPTPVYDTQIAAMVCGFGDQVGYIKLVEAFLNIALDKESRFTDWAQRPLTPKQLQYALNDVIYLEQLYTILENNLNTQGRNSWLDEENAVIQDINLYSIKPEDAWQKLSEANMSPPLLNRLKFLAAWREGEAQRRNIPKNFLLKNETLIAIAANNPSTPEAISKIRGFPSNPKNALIPAITAALQKAKNTPPEEYPLPLARPVKKPPQALTSLLKVLMSHTAEQHQVAPKLIASSDEIASIALGKTEGIKAMKGWRYKIFGQYAEKIKNGTLAIAANDSTTQLIDLEKLPKD